MEKCKPIKQSDAKTGEYSLKFEYDAKGRRIAKHSYDKVGAANGGLGNLVRSTYYVLGVQGNTMSVYERSVVPGNVTFEQAETHIYGSSRIGIRNTKVNLLGSAPTTYNMTSVGHNIGSKNYKLSDHRGNVNTVISDKPIPVVSSSSVAYWQSDIRQVTDFSAFGAELYGADRKYLAVGNNKHRVGFQNQEIDDEIKGAGNSVNYKYRMHDPRLGRFFALDPIAAKYPYNSPYAFSENNVIHCVELEGLEKNSISV